MNNSVVKSPEKIYHFMEIWNDCLYSAWIGEYLTKKIVPFELVNLKLKNEQVKISPCILFEFRDNIKWVWFQNQIVLFLSDWRTKRTHFTIFRITPSFKCRTTLYLAEACSVRKIITIIKNTLRKLFHHRRFHVGV